VDGSGHGTHVAGIIGSAQFGVAKGVALWAVKVLSDRDRGYSSDV
jgi:subtilisin family serine protease